MSPYLVRANSKAKRRHQPAGDEAKIKCIEEEKSSKRRRDPFKIPYSQGIQSKASQFLREEEEEERGADLRRHTGT